MKHSPSVHNLKETDAFDVNELGSIVCVKRLNCNFNYFITCCMLASCLKNVPRYYLAIVINNEAMEMLKLLFFAA